MSDTKRPQTSLISSVSSYVELTRIHMFPTGNDLVYLPCVWGALMGAYSANKSFEEIKHLILPLVIGAIIVHSAACVLSDICDVDFDRQVERTKYRPLVTGAVSMKGAWLLLTTILVPVFWMMAKTNRTAAMLTAFGLFPLHGLYPLMKRWVEIPQIFLGLTMNWGFVVAWAAVTGSVNWDVVPTFMVAAIALGTVYDTIYGCQDRKDDVKAGVKSAALFFGPWVHQVLMAFATIFTLGLAFAGYRNGNGLPFYIVSVGSTALFYVWMFNSWDDTDNADCGRKFKAHGNLAYVIALGMFLDLYSRTT